MSKITTEYCKEYLINHFNEKNITQHQSSRLEMVMIDYSGNRTTRSQELSGKYNDLAFLKNKILAYFSGSNDTDDKPKYRTKF